MPKNFGKNLAKSFKYGVIDTFLETTAPDIAETLKSNKNDLKELMDSGAVKGLTKSDIKNMLNKQTSEIKKGFTDVRKNLISDMKSGKWFGNKERGDNAMMSSMFGDEDMAAFFGDDDFYDGLDLENGSKTVKKSQKSGDIDFNFENKNETNITDNRTNVNNITSIQNKVDGKLLASVTGQMVNSMATVSAQIKQISQFHLDETRRYYNDSLALLTEINGTLKNVYTLQTPKGKTSVLNDVFSGGSLNLVAYGKELSKGMASGLLDKDTLSMVKMFAQNAIADPMKTAISFAMDSIVPKAVKKGMEDLNNNFTNTVKTLVLQLSEGKKGKGTGLQKFLGKLLGLDLNTAKPKFENKAVPFDSETKRSIVNTIPELLLKIHSAITNLGGTGGRQSAPLRIDPETGLPTYKEIKKQRKSDSQFANKLVGGRYDYSSAGLSDRELKAQKEIDKLTQKIKDLEAKKKNLFDTSQDNNIALAKKLLHKREMGLSADAKKKISKARATRDEDFDEFSEMLYKYASTIGNKRGLSSSAIKTISAKEFDRRAAGGLVSETSLDEDIKGLSKEQQTVFANMIKSIEANNKADRSRPAKRKGIKDSWSEAKGDNTGIKGFFRTLTTFTANMTKDMFGTVNRGLSNLMFGNEKGFKSNIAEKIGGWADKNQDAGGIKGFVAKKTSGFLKNRELEKEKREKQMANDIASTNTAVERLLEEATSENCLSVVVQRFGKKAQDFQNDLKDKTITDEMKANGITNKDKFTKILHERLKEKYGKSKLKSKISDIKGGISDTFELMKDSFFSDKEYSIKSKLKVALIGDHKWDKDSSLLSLLGKRMGTTVKQFLFGDKTTKKRGLLTTFSEDFIGYLKENKFVDKWKEIGSIMVDEVRYMTKSLLKATGSLLKKYYGLLFKGVRKIFGFFGRTKLGQKTKSFTREMAERTMGATNFVNKAWKKQRDARVKQFGGTINEDGSYDFTNFNIEAARKAGLGNLASKAEGKGAVSADTRSLREKIQDSAVKVVGAIESGADKIVSGIAKSIKERDEKYAGLTAKDNREIIRKDILKDSEAKFREEHGLGKNTPLNAKQQKQLNKARKNAYKEAEKTNSDTLAISAEYNKGAFNATAAKAAKEEEKRRQQDKAAAEQTAENTSKLVGQEDQKSSKFKKILSYVAMGFLLLKGGTKTITTVIKGIALGIKGVLKVVKFGFKLLAVPIKILNGLTKGAAGKLLSTGALTMLLYTYLASKVSTGIQAVKRGVKATISGVKKGVQTARNVGSGIKGAVAGVKSGAGFMGKVAGGLKGFAGGFKKNATSTATPSGGGLNLNPEKMESSPIYQAEAIIAQKMLEEHGLKNQIDMENFQQRVDSENKNTEAMNRLDMKQKLGELKEKGKQLLEKFKNSALYDKLKLARDKIMDKAGSAIEFIGKGAKGLLTAMQGIPFGKVAAIGLGAAAVAGITAMIVKSIKNAKKDKPSEGGDEGGFLSKLKKNNEAKKAEKRQKKEDKLKKKKEKIKAVITSEEFPKMSLIKKAYWKSQAKKYGVSLDAGKTNKLASAIDKANALANGDETKKSGFGSKLKSFAKFAVGLSPAGMLGSKVAGKAFSTVGKLFNPFTTVSAAGIEGGGDKPQIGQEKDGMIYNGSKWISKAKLSTGQKFGNMIWNGERLIASSKEAENIDRQTWNEQVLSTGLLGETMDSRTTKKSSLGSKLKSLKDFVADKLGFTKDENGKYVKKGSDGSYVSGGSSAVSGSYSNYNNISSDNAAIIWKYFKDKGFSDAGVAGIMGNLQAESGLKTNNLQNDYEKSLGSDTEYTAKVNDGSYKNFANDKGGYGLAQWTSSNRKQGLLDFAKSRGTGIDDLTTQLDYLYKELGDYGLVDSLKNASSVRAASDIMVTKFEKPAGMNSEGLQSTRANYGTGYLNNYGNGQYTSKISSEPENVGGTVNYASNSELVNGFPYYSQGDMRWANIMYSATGNPTQTIKASACGPTSMAMVLRSFGEEVSPVETASYSLTNGFRTANSGTSWSFFPSIGKKYGLNVDNIGGNVESAESYLRNGYPIIASGKGATPFTSGGHFVVLSGTDGNGNIMVNDPVSKDRSKKYSKSSLKSKIANMWAFSKNGKGSIGSVPKSTSSTPSASASASSTFTSTPSSTSMQDIYIPTATSTGFDTTSTAVSAAVTSGAAVSSKSSGYSEVLTKLTTISTILANIATYDQATANSIKEFLENSTNNNSTNESDSNKTPAVEKETIKDGGHNNFFTATNTSNYLGSKYGNNISALYSKFLKPTTIEIARGN